MSKFLYKSLDLEITLRCNAFCKNCFKFCNMHDKTGLNYYDSDMTLEQIDRFIDQVTEVSKIQKEVIEHVFITGGEPLLHPQVYQIFDKVYWNLFSKGIIGNLLINSNLIIKAPDAIKPFIVNLAAIEEKAQRHNTVLLHPDDLPEMRPTFAMCNHIRKRTVVLCYHGYSLCCAADGYIRLLGLDDLIIDKLPSSYSKFPLDKMDKVCNHCPFGCDYPPLEIHAGAPVSKLYAEQAELNKFGRKIMKRF
jgi:hypothetical protein